VAAYTFTSMAMIGRDLWELRCIVILSVLLAAAIGSLMLHDMATQDEAHQTYDRRSRNYRLLSQLRMERLDCKRVYDNDNTRSPPKPRRCISFRKRWSAIFMSMNIFVSSTIAHPTMRRRQQQYEEEQQQRRWKWQPEQEPEPEPEQEQEQPKTRQGDGAGGSNLEGGSSNIEESSSASSTGNGAQQQWVLGASTHSWKLSHSPGAHPNCSVFGQCDIGNILKATDECFDFPGPGLKSGPREATFEMGLELLS